MEQQVETFVPALPPLPVVIDDYFSPTCAWCLERRGLPKGEGSHGICHICAAIWLVESKAKLAAQRAARAATQVEVSEVKCQCTMTALGRVVCDLCAAKSIEAANSQLGVEMDRLPVALEPDEAAEVSERINTWFLTLQLQKETVEA